MAGLQAVISLCILTSVLGQASTETVFSNFTTNSTSIGNETWINGTASTTSTTTTTTTTTMSTTATVSVLTNCTRCIVWNGDECFENKRCSFCNDTIQCEDDRFLCKDNVCVEHPDQRSLGTQDPLGRVIALILLTIFMLSLFTLCLRVCSNICGTNGPDRRCCVLHCALSIQCCCEWKAGRLRIIPDSPDGLRGRPGVDHAQASTAVVGSPATRRAALYPPPPPAYLEIFPTGSNSNQNNNNNSTNGEDSTSATTNHHSSATGGRGSSSNTEGASTRQLHSRNNSTGDAISTLSANITTDPAERGASGRSHSEINLNINNNSGNSSPPPPSDIRRTRSGRAPSSGWFGPVPSSEPPHGGRGGGRRADSAQPDRQRRHWLRDRSRSPRPPTASRQNSVPTGLGGGGIWSSRQSQYLVPPSATGDRRSFVGSNYDEPNGNNSINPSDETSVNIEVASSEGPPLVMSASALEVDDNSNNNNNNNTARPSDSSSSSRPPTT